MLRITQTSGGTKGVQNYYSKGLETADYYTKEMVHKAKWNGRTAEKLGLSGEITKEDFFALTENTNPITGEKITPRNKDNKRLGYDFTFNAPKSVSVAVMLGRDKKLIDAFQDSVKETMNEIETNMETRVRKNGKNENRNTGNIVWGNFTHLTSRPVNGVPDMHLHTHAYVLNMTYDSKEERFKAGQFGNIKSNAPYYEAIFHSHLSSKVKELGYEIEHTKNGWEIAGIDKELRDKFSLRTKEIESEAERKIQELHIVNEERKKEGLTTLSFREKDKADLGARTRVKKIEDYSTKELISMWKERLSDTDKNSISNLKNRENRPFAIEKKKEDQVIDYALEHSLERQTSISEKKLLTTALKNSYGSFNPQEIKKALHSNSNAIKRKFDKETYVTSKSALAEEKNIIAVGVSGKGKFKPLNKEYKPKADFLNDQQKKAIKNTLSSKDQISIIEGRAGVGKTTLMTEVKDGIIENNKSFFAFAPTTKAVEVQQKEGFDNAKTIAYFIVNEKEHSKIKNSVVWVDEAGLVGNKDMSQLLNIAKSQNARVILTGDTRQHRSVPRGNSMELLQSKAGIKASIVKEIQRQRNAKDYKEAVKLISDKKIDEGLDKLEEMGSIKEITDSVIRNEAIADDYLKSVELGQKTLIIAPTHKEGENITDTLREKLKNSGNIGSDDFSFIRHKNKNLTIAQKGQVNNYVPNDVIEFNQNVKGGFIRGGRYEVKEVSESGVLVENDKGITSPLPLNASKKFQVYEKHKINLATNDKIMITKGGKSQDGKKLNNGSIYSIQEFTPKGNMVLSNGAILDKDHRNIKHAYTITSHSSQGKTVDNVIIAQSSISFPASSEKQLYVSISRGRKNATIYTDNKEDFRNAVSRDRDYISASDLVDKGKVIREQHRFLQRARNLKNIYTTRAKDYTKSIHDKIKGHEKTEGKQIAIRR